MFRARASFALLIAAAVATSILSTACKTETKPPISSGPGNGAVGVSGSGGGTDGGGDGGNAGQFATFDGFTPSGIASDGDTIYVTLIPIDTTAAGVVVRVDPSGVITSLVTDAVAPTAPTVSGGALYYLDKPSGLTPSAVMRLDLSNISGGEKALVSGVTNPSALVVVGSSVFVASSSGGTGVEVDSVPIAGGTSTPITSLPGEYSPAGLATDGTTLYFAARGVTGGEIASSPIAGGPASLVWAGTDVGALGPIFLANGSIYFSVTSDPNGAVYSVPVLGTVATPLATGLTAPSGIVTADPYVYYTSNVAAGSIYRALLQADAGVAPESVGAIAYPNALALGSSVVYATTDNGVVRVLK